MEAQPVGNEREGGPARFAPLLAVAFVVLFFVSALLTNTPDEDASDSVWTSYFADSGHRAELIIAAFAFTAAAMCLLGFFSWLWFRVAQISADGRGLNPLPLATVVVAATCVGINGVANAVIAGGMAFGSLPEPSPDILRFSDEIGWPILTVVGMIALAVAMASLSLEARRAGVFSSRMTTFSLIAAAFTAFSVVFFPLILMLIWFLVVGISLFRSGGETATIAA